MLFIDCHVRTADLQHCLIAFLFALEGTKLFTVLAVEQFSIIPIPHFQQPVSHSWSHRQIDTLRSHYLALICFCELLSLLVFSHSNLNRSIQANRGMHRKVEEGPRNAAQIVRAQNPPNGRPVDPWKGDGWSDEGRVSKIPS